MATHLISVLIMTQYIRDLQYAGNSSCQPLSMTPLWGDLRVVKIYIAPPYSWEEKSCSWNMYCYVVCWLYYVSLKNWFMNTIIWSLFRDRNFVRYCTLTVCNYSVFNLWVLEKCFSLFSMFVPCFFNLHLQKFIDFPRKKWRYRGKIIKNWVIYERFGWPTKIFKQIYEKIFYSVKNLLWYMQIKGNQIDLIMWYPKFHTFIFTCFAKFYKKILPYSNNFFND